MVAVFMGKMLRGEGAELILCLFSRSDRQSDSASLFGGVFFSSRRRHTRLQGDWSSDVCSSDLKKYQDNKQDSAEHGRPHRLSAQRRRFAKRTPMPEYWFPAGTRGPRTAGPSGAA